MINKGLRREKNGVVKEHKQMELYKSEDERALTPKMMDSEKTTYSKGKATSVMEN